MRKHIGERKCFYKIPSRQILLGSDRAYRAFGDWIASTKYIDAFLVENIVFVRQSFSKYVSVRQYLLLLIHNNYFILFARAIDIDYRHMFHRISRKNIIEIDRTNKLFADERKLVDKI